MNLIEFDKKHKIFHLHNRFVSYLIEVDEGGILSHLYFGKPVKAYHGQRHYPRLDRGFSGNLPGSLDRTYSRDSLLQEYSSAGACDYRTPALVIKTKDGARAADLRYKSHKITAGKPNLAGLPQSYVEDDAEAQTLIITLEDTNRAVSVDLMYTIYANRAVVTRATRVVNSGDAALTLEKVASLQVDLPKKARQVVSFPGAHANERHLQREEIGFGTKRFESRRGTSSHQMNPFITLCDPTTTEFSGEALGFLLVYSGNHLFEVEKDQYNQVRVLAGINDANFAWHLAGGESFQTPEVIMAYSTHGFNGMSKTYHRLLHDRVARGKFKNEPRPIVVNNWEATYFGFDEDRLRPIVDEAKELGIEMFVLDDGWFGHRDDDNSSLGDWSVFKKKFPNGLAHFVDYVHAQGLKFGLWFEPEMISFDSNLYKSHPEYMLRVPNRAPSPSRNQYVLDMGNPAVQKNIYDQVAAVLANNRVDYVKWDMNRHLSDVYSAALPPDRQGEVLHRYVLGLYALLEKLTTAFPNVLFEGCSGGGGRFDAGFLYYMPQSWTSDNTDAIARMTIQYGTTYAYPASAMTAHLSAVPNHQTGRVTPFETRGAVAMAGVFGYELDLTKLTEDEKAQVKAQVNHYKRIRSLVQTGDFYRLINPVGHNRCAWMFVAKDKKEAFVSSFRVLADAQPDVDLIKLVGLDPDYQYEDQETHTVYGGDELMNIGFFEDFVRHDYATQTWHFVAK